ncbi:hypothetical protein [Mycobacterium sp.]|uniref:hypothetical protein n=1 Tax=Mycobacterium sp. TaxID=1785 RepID=UPI0025EB2411|nr:hypothetical protein [Mycobacterium sp.]
MLLTQCPPGVELLNAQLDAEFVDGVVYYFGETLHRAKASHWSFSAEVSAATGHQLAGLSISTNHSLDGFPLAVYLVQDINGVVKPMSWRDPPPASKPDRLRRSYDSWVIAAMRTRVENPRKRREQTKRKSGRKKSDGEVLARWLATRNDEFDSWADRFGNSAKWDFSVGSLDMLEALIRQQAPGPEDLLEDKSRADFLDGAAWYLGETVRRLDPDHAEWAYDRDYHPDPYLWSGTPTDIFGKLADVYLTGSGALRKWARTST